MVTVIWGSAFVAQRFAAIRMDILLFNGFRYLVGTLILIPLAWKLPRRQPSNLDDSRQTKMGIFLAGVMLFAGATLQQWGLRYTTAGNPGFITGLYVVLVPLLLAVFWRQKPRQSIVIAALVAAVGSSSAWTKLICTVQLVDPVANRPEFAEWLDLFDRNGILLRYIIFEDGFESGSTSEWSSPAV